MLTKALFLLLQASLAQAEGGGAPELGQWLNEIQMDDGEWATSAPRVLIVDAGVTPSSPFLVDDSEEFQAHALFQTVEPEQVAFAVSLNSTVGELHPTKEQLIALSAADVKLESDRTLPRQRELARWLSDALGYNAVVLDQRGKFVLVRGPRAALQHGGQALLLADSAERDRLPKGARRGIGLMSKIAASGDFAVFEVILANRAPTVPRGSKVILEDP